MKINNLQQPTSFHVSYLTGFRGSLFTRNLAELVKREDFVLESEYLQTVLVIVPK
jgi:hypothetical protein